MKIYRNKCKPYKGYSIKEQERDNWSFKGKKKEKMGKGIL